MNELFFKKKYQNHLLTKPQMLHDIVSMGIHGVHEWDQKLSNTDWHLSREYERKYIKHILPEINFLINDINSYYYPKKNHPIKLANYWFQQYHMDDWHSPHVHGSALFSCVYYLELPIKSSKTSFYFSNKQFEIDIEEGDILCFPSFFMHESKPNQSNRKTVIAFNLST